MALSRRFRAWRQLVRAHPGSLHAHPGSFSAHLDSPYAHPGSFPSHLDSPFAHPGSPFAHPGSPFAHPGSPFAHPGSFSARPGSFSAHPGSLSAHPGSPSAHPGSLYARPGSLYARPGSLYAHPGSFSAHPGSFSAHPGSFSAHLDSPFAHPDSFSARPGSPFAHPDSFSAHLDSPFAHPDSFSARTGTPAPQRATPRRSSGPRVQHGRRQGRPEFDRGAAAGDSTATGPGPSRSGCPIPCTLATMSLPPTGPTASPRLFVWVNDVTEVRPLSAFAAKGRATLGRGKENDVQIDHSSVSRLHAILHFGPPARDRGPRQPERHIGPRATWWPPTSCSRSAPSAGRCGRELDSLGCSG
jgi:FHA domain